MTYVIITYQNKETGDTLEKIERYRFKWIAKLRCMWLDMYNEEGDESLLLNVHYKML